MQELEKQLKEDISRIGLTEEFNLSLRPYSKTYFGRYDPNTSTVIIYVQKNTEGDLYPYVDLLLTTVHEVIHCVQWHDPNFKRVKGVMHNTEFKKLYARYSNRAKAMLLLREVNRNANIYSEDCREVLNACSISH